MVVFKFEEIGRLFVDRIGNKKFRFKERSHMASLPILILRLLRPCGHLRLRGKNQPEAAFHLGGLENMVRATGTGSQRRKIMQLKFRRGS